MSVGVASERSDGTVGGISATGGNRSSRSRTPSSNPAPVGTGGGGTGAGDPCAIVDTGTLRSPPPGIQQALGHTFPVKLEAVGGLDVLVMSARTLGAVRIDCPREEDIIACIHLGNRYEATVQRVQGGAVVVGVRRSGAAAP